MFLEEIKMINQAKQSKDYDLWSDSAYDDYDYEAEIKREYEELGYNPREVNPVGKEKSSQ